jgi:anti-sigma regulatory factor (Ser/Thr protein kinase)
MILRLSLDLPEEGAYVPLARHLGRCLLEYMKVAPEDVSDVETLVTELVANVVRHAHSTEGRFQVALDYFADRVVMTVADAGQGFSFRDVPPVGTARPDFGGGERLGGFGMPLLEALSDRLEFTRTDPHGTTVRAEKRLRYETAESSAAAEGMDEAGALISICGPSPPPAGGSTELRTRWVDRLAA